MDKDNAQQGNPGIGMTEDSFDSVDNSSGSSEDFFAALENNVNGAISDSDFVSEETPQQVDPNTGHNEENQVSDTRSNSEDELGKKMKAQLDELQPFIPVLNAMKKDSGLVDHMRNYLESGGNVPTNIKSQLKLDEDFEFDVDDMVNNPDSDSAKVFTTMVDKVVNKKASQILSEEQKKANDMRESLNHKKEAEKFMEERGMNEDEFHKFVNEARERLEDTLSLEDMYHLVNRDKVNKNVATSTKEDMLKQMKGVRDMPTSQAGVNNAGTSKKSTHDKMFEALLDFDSGVDNMFG